MSLAFVFPGQGSQSIGMLNALAAEFPVVEKTFQEASSALGLDLWQIVTAGPEEQLNRTENTQPAMLTAGVATWRVWRELGGAMPSLMAGHSLGEYTALVCGESLLFADTVRLVADRGRFMQEAVPIGQGAMAALLGLDDETVRKVCQAATQGDVVEAVNFNAPGQVVIAGSKAAVERAIAQAKEAGAKRAVLLPVSVPSHCSLMHPAAERLRARLDEIDVRSPNTPVVHNVHVATESDPSGIRAALSRQVESPVRWVETIEHMAQEGVTRLVECGPGKILTGLNKRIAKSVDCVAVFDPASMREAVEA